MKNIFENAYFGKPYKTRDGRKAILLDESFDSLILNFGTINKVGSFIQYTVNSFSGILMQEGKEFKDYPCELDIVSEWQEEPFGNTSDAKLKFGDTKILIDKEELNKFVERYYERCKNHDEQWQDIIEARKTGYRKAFNL